MLLVACARPNPLFAVESSETGDATADDDAGATFGPSTASTTGMNPNGSAEGTAATAGGQDGTGGSATESDDDDDDAEVTGDDDDAEVTGDDDDDTTDGTVVSPCCESSDLPGCADEEIETCVCALDSFCCDTQWDAMCINIATASCGAMCPNEGDCCLASPALGCGEPLVEACVCELDASCCDEAWNTTCAQTAAEACGAECFSDTDCCAVNPGVPGCGDTAVWGCVCTADPFCCSAAWDALCVVEAVACRACPAAPPGDCCVPSLNGGCTDAAGGPGVMNCVCQFDPTCCAAEWSEMCVLTAQDMCSLACV